MNIHIQRAKMNIIILAVCAVAVIAAAAAVYFSSGRDYETVSGKVEMGSSEDGAAEPAKGGSESFASKDGSLVSGGITVAAGTDIPEGFDPFRYIKQGYELKNFAAVDSFSSASELPVNPAVQYAFCYLYADGGCLTDLKTGPMTYRKAGADEIQRQLEELFGSFEQDIKQSNLYVSDGGYFEMWQPDYSAQVYASARILTDRSGIVLKVTYFEDAEKENAAGTAEITVKKGKKGYYIASLT